MHNTYNKGRPMYGECAFINNWPNGGCSKVEKMGRAGRQLAGLQAVREHVPCSLQSSPCLLLKSTF